MDSLVICQNKFLRAKTSLSMILQTFLRLINNLIDRKIQINAVKIQLKIKTYLTKTGLFWTQDLQTKFKIIKNYEIT